MTGSSDLMKCRIRSLLLICNGYDAFSLEEDGLIETQIRNEYLELGLSNPPEIFKVETTAEALDLLSQGRRFDLVLTMYNVGKISVYDFAKKAKEYAPEMPVVLLASYAREFSRDLEKHSDSAIDQVFFWNGSADLIIAIIKLLEDRQNAAKDILELGVQAILLVEDSVKYYSTYLPALYKIILQQNLESIKDTLNEQQQLLRKRSRPKVLMATNFDDAVSLFEKYKDNLLGIISDVGFVIHRDDKSSEEKSDAGVDLCRLVRKSAPKMAFLMQSSQESMKSTAKELGAGFLCKSSNVLLQELGEYLEREFGFGDFVVIDPATNAEIARASDLFEFENVLKTIPDAAFKRLSDNNYLSKWLYARGLFAAGRELSPVRADNYDSIDEHRAHDISVIHDFRIAQALGVVAAFDDRKYNNSIRFARIGSGSMGGKARGLAFLNHVMQKHNLYSKWEGVRVLVPRTLVIGTDWFDRFIKDNGLKSVINSDVSDTDLLNEFVASPIPADLTASLRAFLKVVRTPLAVRSSSKLEDSYRQPFAGVYSTYMLPNADNDDLRLRMLAKAIKSVYASVYFSAAKSYIVSSGNVVPEEKMGIVIQEICGSEDSGYFFPTFSGVARSVNFYPVGHEKPEDGIVKLAFGLGQAVVDGEQVLRFSPKYPKNVLQTSTTELVMKETQNRMYALSTKVEKFKLSIDDTVNIEKLKISDCQNFKSFRHVVSTWDQENMRMVDSAFPEGPKYVTFAPMLKYGTFPVAEIVSELLDILKNEMKCDIEIEFAADLEHRDHAVFTVLQVRPIVSDTKYAEIDWSCIDSSDAFLTSGTALGTGWTEGVRDIVYLKKSAWNVLKTREMAKDVTKINARMLQEHKGYVLIGFGRWGTIQESLGVPVAWSHISEAKVLVECSLEDFRVEPSQGTHFFQNLTSFNVGYVNVNPFESKDDKLDFDLLDSLPCIEETEYLRHIRLEKDMQICIDGKTGKAMIKIKK